MRLCGFNRPPLRHRTCFYVAALFGSLLAGACGGNAPAAQCLQPVDTACAPLYSPTYDQVFARTLHPTCGLPGSSCHAAAGANGGLVFEDADKAYALLLGEGGGKVRVIAGDPACSLLVERVDAVDASRTMPPGAPLSGPERCAIVQWISNGAKR